MVLADWMDRGEPPMICGMSIFAACNRFKPIVTICKHGFQKPWGCYMPIIFRTGNLPQRAVSGDHRFTIIWQQKERVLAR